MRSMFLAKLAELFDFQTFFYFLLVLSGIIADSVAAGTFQFN
jgi:hypothetical protein